MKYLAVAIINVAGDWGFVHLCGDSNVPMAIVLLVAVALTTLFTLSVREEA